jgi:multiple antibiotic resistance protein
LSDVLNATLVAEVFITLFVIMDPPGAIPLFLSLTHGLSPRARKVAAWQAVAVAFGVIVVFAVFGREILDYLHISLPALQCAGGLLLLLVALELLTGREPEVGASKDVNVALVPLGTPLLAGPGAIVATMVFAESVDETAELVSVALGLIAVHLVMWATLRYSTLVIRVIRESGITLVTRISGLLVSAIAVQLIADSIRAFIAGEG